MKSQKDDMTWASFWSNVLVGEPDKCWPWMLSRDRYGYGQGRLDGSLMRAHRVAFYIVNGYYPPVVMHSCDNPPCCNPAHLKAGTQTENVEDMILKGRSSQGRISQEIIAMVKSSTGTQREIARRFGIGKTTVHKIVNGIGRFS